MNALVSNSVHQKCKPARDSKEVKILLFQLGALVSNFVHMKCKTGRDSKEVKSFLFQFGALVSNSVHMKCKTTRLRRSQDFVISVGCPS